MSSSHEAEKLEEPEFKWGKKRGIGGKKKDVQFYETFTYDGVDYALYDCVFMYKEGEPAPYIGKIVKIWANPDKSNSKRVKVHWFFRPSEIAHHLKDEKVLENELFFASGDGTGLANLNPLEAIAGKCHVVCISTDSRNPQPSAEELKMADYVFYRVFDVKSCTVSDQFNATVGGIEVKFVFNRSEKEVSSLDSNSKNQDRNLITLKIAGESTPQELDNVKVDENGDHVLEREDKNAKQVKVKEQNLIRECSSGVEERMKSARKPGNLDDRPLKKAKSDGAVLSSKTKDANSVQSLTLTGKDESQLKNSVGSGKDVKLTEMSKEKTRLGRSEDAVGLDKEVKSTKDSNAASQGKPSKTNAFPSAENPESAHAKDSVSIEKDKRKGEKSSDFREKSSTNVVSPDETATPRKTSVSSDETPKKTGPLEGSEQASKLVKSSSASTKRPLKTSTNLSKGKSKLGNDAYLGEKDSTLEGWPPKKGKIDDSVKMTKDNKNNIVKKLKEKASVGETQNSSMHLTSDDNKAKSRLDNGALKEHNDEKVGKFSNDKLPNPLMTRFEGDDRKRDGQIFEVTQRPNVEKSNWMKLPWEDRMKAAHDQGRLVLLQNLYPEYTSGEVEDIVWHAFRENCTAKMVSHTATSNPYSGQAFVIFKTREAMEKVVKKLEDGCLMLPNRRPLVVCPVVLPKKSEKQTFAGHLAIEKARRQIQRELKDAVSTSHYSQNNTVEYEMAMAWCFLQEKSDKWWEKLYEQQRKELKRLEDGLKSK